MPPSAKLEQQLASYSISAHGYLSPRQGQSASHWSLYAAAASSALAMAGQADAAIIYSGANRNVTIERFTSFGTGGTFSSTKILSVDTGGGSQPVAKINLFNAGTNTFAQVSTFSPLAGVAPIISSAFPTAIGKLKKFASGDTIGAGLGITSGVAPKGVAFSYGGGLAPAWTLGVTAFAGFATTVTGQKLGWVRLKFESDPALTVDGRINRVTAIDWAYNTDVTGIKAGVTAAIPEPEAPALALLALGAVGIRAMRRRRTPPVA